MKRNNINILIASLALFATLTFFTGLIYINNQEKPERYIDNGPILIVDRPTIPKKYIDLPSYNPIKKEIEVEDEKVVVVEKTKDKVKSIAKKPEKITLSDLSNYKQTLNLAAELDYTENSWQKYLEVIMNNVVSNKDSQKAVNEATKQIENAQTLLETKEAYNLRVRKDFAIEDINCYINIDDYTFNGRQALDVINQCSNSIEQAETISLIDETLNSSKAKLDQIMSDQAILARLKDVAKQDLDNYKNSNLYRLNLTTFNELIRDGKNAIDNSLTKEAIDNSLNAAKSKLDSLKTDNQIVAENYRPPAKSELTIAKETALNAIMTYKDEADYTKNLADLQSAISNAKALIDSSTTIELVDAALINAKGIIESILSDENEIELAFKNN